MKKITIGRAPESTIVVDEVYAKVSNEHADVVLENDVLTFVDHSTNGTLINGIEVKRRPQVIRYGDEISLAKEYVLGWDVLLEYFPEMKPRQQHRPTELFEPVSSKRKTELFDPSNISYAQQSQSQPEPQPVYTPESTQVAESAPEPEPDPKKTEYFGNRPSSIPRSEVTGGVSAVKKVYGRENTIKQEVVDEAMDQLNPGAFLASWVWGAFNGVYWPMFFIPVFFVPYLGQVCSLFLCTYLLIHGNSMAWSKYKGDSLLKFQKSQKAWIVPGVLLFVLFAAVQIMAINYIL